MTSTKSFASLLYHKVSHTACRDPLNLTAEEFDKQLRLLKLNGYNPVSLSDLVDHAEKGTELPSKPVLITFDDGYKETYTVAYPLLEKYRIKANVFLVSDFMQNAKRQPAGKEEFLTPETLHSMDPELVEYGLHTAEHIDYRKCCIDQICEDLSKCINTLNDMGVKFQPCLAYPYGAYPKKDDGKKLQLFETLRASGVRLAFRIGNRINQLPVKDRFELQRIEIRKNQPLWKFKRDREFFSSIPAVYRGAFSALFSFR